MTLLMKTTDKVVITELTVVSFTLHLERVQVEGIIEELSHLVPYNKGSYLRDLYGALQDGLDPNTQDSIVET